MERRRVRPATKVATEIRASNSIDQGLLAGWPKPVFGGSAMLLVIVTDVAFAGITMST